MSNIDEYAENFGVSSDEVKAKLCKKFGVTNVNDISMWNFECDYDERLEVMKAVAQVLREERDSLMANK